MSAVNRDVIVKEGYSPKSSRYDSISAGLIASIIVCGFIVACLFAVWFFDNRPVSTFLPEWDQRESQVTELPLGLDQELDEVAGGTNSVELVSLLEAVENAVSQLAASDGSPGIGDSLPGDPDRRIPGPTPPDFFPAVKRWKVRYEVADREQYKRQLEYFDIEVGVLASKSDEVWRVNKVASNPTATKSDRSSEQESAWFVHSNPLMRTWDRQIVIDAGVDVTDSLVVQFYSAELMDRISTLEAKRLDEDGLELSEIRRTDIVILSSDDGFTISVSGFEIR